MSKPSPVDGRRDPSLLEQRRIAVADDVVSDTSAEYSSDASEPAPGDASLIPRVDVSRAAAATARKCGWCPRDLGATRSDAKYCSRKCRQSAFRIRQRGLTNAAEGVPLRFAYADPPYPGKAHIYRGHPDFAGEVDHASLLQELRTGGYDGWALSTSAKSLRWILPMCPEGVRVCPWVKPIGASSRTYGLHNTWEPLLVVPGRHRRPGKRDWLRAMPARGGGDLLGRKPLAFCAFLFEALGMQPGDELDDLFPGSGVIMRAWRELSPRS